MRSLHRVALFAALFFAFAAAAQSVDLSVSISDSPDPLTLGQGDITYSVSVYNGSSNVANNVTLTFNAPPESTIGTFSANFSGSCNPAGQVVTCTWSSIAAFNSRNLTVDVTPTAGGALNATATASANESDSNNANNSATATTTVNAQIDLKISSISDSPDPLTLGQGNVTYTITAYNESSSKATNPFVNVTIPAGAVFVSAVASNSGACGTGSSFTCNWSGDFSAFNTRTVTVTVTPTAGGTNTLSATVGADQGDPDASDNTLSQSTTVNAQIDLKVNSISDSPDPITLGQGNITYTVNLYNESSSKATNAFVNITIPASSTFVSASASNSGTCGTGSSFTCNWSGDFNAFNGRTVTVVVTPTAGGTATLSATVGADQADPDATDNTGSQSTTVNAQIDLKVNSIADSPDPITLGQGNITYTVNLYNESTSKATNPFVNITIPASSVFVSAVANNGGTCGSGSAFTCNWSGDFNAFNNRAVTVTITPTAGGTNTLTAIIGADQGDPDPGDNTLSESTTVNAQIDLKVNSIVDSPDPITLGTGNITYTVNLYNESTSKATNAFVNITIPASSTFVSAVASNSGTCGSGASFTCNWSGDFLAFNNRTITVTVTPTAGGTATLSATIGADQSDPDVADNTGSQSTTVNAQIDLKVSSISDVPDPLTLGQGNITYIVNLYNESSSKATNPFVNITIPASSIFVSAVANNGGTCGSGASFTCNWSGDFNAFNSRQITVVVTPTAGGPNTLSATIGADQGDPDASDNTGSESTTVNAQIDLKVSSISDSPDPITLGTGNITYTVNLYNESTSKATNPFVNITIPPASAFVSASANNGGTCGSGASFTCNWSGDFNAFNSRQVTIVVTPAAGGTLTLNASIAADQSDPDVADNSGSQSTTVNASIDIQLTLGDSPDPRVLGAGNVTYTVSLYNASTSKATNPVVTFTLPASVTFVSATPNASGTCNAPSGGAFTCSWSGDYNAFNSRSISVVVTPGAVGQISATASVTADQPDPLPANNAATQTTNINPNAPPTVSGFTPASGPSGTSVTINGTNFYSTSAVKFNGTSAAFTTVSNSQVVATVPAGATTGVISITNVSGSSSSASSFTVTPAPDLAIAKNASAPTVPVSTGFSYTIDVTNGGAGAANDVTVTDTLPAGVTFGSISAPGWSCSGTSSITCTAGALAAGNSMSTITINVTAPSTGTTVANTATVSTTTPEASTANNSSTASVGVVGCPTTPPITVAAAVCTNTTGHTASIPSVPGATYAWSATNATITSGATSNVITFDATTASPITLNVSVFVTSCPTVSNSATVTVSNPTASITPSGPTTFCTGGSVTLTANTGSSYLWSNGATTQSINVTSAGAYSVTVTDAAGCSATSATTNVTVNPVPTATITPSGPTTFCSGGSVTLTAPGGMAGYLWSNGATTPSIVVTSSGSYTVTVTNASGCSDTSAPANVTVDPTPSASITPDGPTTFCSGGSVTLSASGGGSYLWSNGATTPSITVTSTGTYSVTVTNGSCSATSAPVNVNVTPSPTATITASGPTTFCSGGSVLLSAPAGMTSYLWSNGATTPSISVTSSGNYSVTVTDGSGCSATSAPTTVTVDPTPSASITASGPTTFCAGGSVTLNASGTGTYLWSNGETTPSIVVTSTGTYSVTVTNGSCSSTSSPVNVTVNPAPNAVITGPSATCSTAAVTLDAGPGFASYLWSNGATTQQITVNPSATTTYSVTVSNGSCSASDTHEVSVTTTPDAAITAPPGLCENATNQTASVPSQAGATYAWTIANGTIVGAANTSSILFNAGSGGPVTLNVVVTNGSCSSPGTVSIPTSAYPVFTIAGPASTCPRTAYTLSVPAGFASYLWSNGATSPSISVSQTEGSKTYSVTVTNAGGCATTVSHIVTLAAQPLASITAPTVSTNNATGLAATVAAQPGAAYDWNVVNGAITSGQGTNAITFSTGATGASAIVSVNVTIGGCTARDTHSITLNNEPACPFRANPQLLAPAPAAIVTSPVPFTWTGVANASGYRLFIDSNGTGPQLLGTTSGATTLTASVPSGSVIAWVEAQFAGCPSTRSANVPFTVRVDDSCATRGTATLLAPANGATVTSSVVEFRWSAAGNATAYRVWTSINGAAFAVAGETADVELRATIASGNVSWYVESLYPGCASTESQRSTFTIPPRSECSAQLPQPASPANGASATTRSVTFQWTAVSDAIAYELWLSLDNGSPTLLGTTTQTSLAATVPEGKLRWFVRVIADRCPSRDSQRFALTIDLPDDCAANLRPLAIEPVDRATATSPVTFNWTALDGAEVYQLFAVQGEQTSLLATVNAPQAVVAMPNGRVRWFVRARFGGGCQPLDSTERDLNVIPMPAACATLARPVLSMPGQISSGKPFRIQWTPVPGATSYELQLDSTAAFTNPESIGKGSSTQHETLRTNIGSAPVPLYARVRARDTRCANGIESAWSLPIAVFVLPAQSEEAVLPLAQRTNILFTLPLGPELARQTFTATPKQEWLVVTPSQGIVPPNGITLTVTATTSGLPVGTSLGAVAITLTDPSSGNAAANGTTLFTPGFSVSLVTPITPTPKSAPPPDALIIPAVAHASGINAEFQSDVRVSNTSAKLMNYQITFTPSGEAGIAEGKQSTFSIEPGQTIALDDVLRSWFGTGSQSTTGTLEIRPITEDTPSAGEILNSLSKLVTFASSRTFNVTPNGTFGQFIPAIPFANFVDSTRALSLQQIAHSSRYRTNLGIVEGSGEPAQLLVRIFGDGGAKLTEFPLSLNGGQHLQLNGFLAQHGISSLTDGRVEIAVTSGTGKITAYASVLDNDTSDPLLVTPVTLTDSGNTKWVVPGVADIDTGGANWQTDMRVFNAGTEDVQVSVAFHSQNGGDAKTTAVTIPAGQVLQFDRALASLFGVANDGGAVHISTANAARLIATARTYNQTTGGTYGQFISAVTTNEAAGIDSRPLQLLQVEESSRFRTNVGLAEVTGHPVTIEISVVPPDAKFTAVTELTLAANEFRQLGSVLRSVGLEETYNARVTVRTIQGEGRVAAYASVIDLLTNDPTYVPAQ
jgi:uncharacterized repeat protein (TIGR01451 family)